MVAIVHPNGRVDMSGSRYHRMMVRRSSRDSRFDKKALWKELHADIRKADRAKIADLRRRLRELRGGRPGLMREAKESCRTGRVSAMLLARSIEAKAKEEARAVRQEAKNACLARVDKARGHRAEVARLLAELEAERKHQRELRTIARGQRQRHPGVRKMRAERQGESDDEVRQNIPHELVPLFNRVRRGIKGSSRMSRTEAFLHYAEEHPSEQYAGIDDKTDALVAELERQARAGRRDARRRRYF